jgi:protein TonB
MLKLNPSSDAVRQPADYWPAHERLAGPAVGSLLFHLAFGVSVVGFGLYYHHFHGQLWGAENAGGAIQATLVSSAPTLPLPKDVEPNNEVLATENPNEAPAPPQPKTIAKPDDRAIPIASKNAKPDLRRQDQNKQPPKPDNKAHFGEAAAGNIPRSTPGQTGAGNQPVNVGGDFGTRFAYYIGIIRSNVSRNWMMQEVDPHTPEGSQVVVTFNVSKSGNISGIRIATASGSPTLNQSAIRAVQRVDALPPLPNAYAGSSISVEYTFPYQRLH